MERHKSRPYNPDIANTFFRAGYVETWGRGIQKICEACKKHGLPEPEYSVLGGDITVKFKALQSSKAPKLQNKALDEALEKRILAIIKENPKIKQTELSDILETTRTNVQRLIKRMVEQGVLERKGGKRYGYWEVCE